MVFVVGVRSHGHLIAELVLFSVPNTGTVTPTSPATVTTTAPATGATASASPTHF